MWLQTAARFPRRLAASAPSSRGASEIGSAGSHRKRVLAAILESHSHQRARSTIHLKAFQQCPGGVPLSRPYTLILQQRQMPCQKHTMSLEPA